MKKSGVLAIATILVGVLFSFSSCEQATNTEFEESFEKVKEVTPIAGAQNAKMDLRNANNEDSYFTVSLNDGTTREGWCIEWNEQSITGIQEGVDLYSTKGQEAWKELNYFMAIKDDLMAQDPELTSKEIQVVIWSLVDNPSFDVDKISEYENIESRIVKDGEPQFDVQKVKNIVNQVDQYFEDNKNKNWFWWWNYFLILIHNDGQTIMTSSGALSYVAFDTGCDETVSDWNTDSDGDDSFSYVVETDYKQNTGNIKFEAEGDQLGEGGVEETDTFQFTIACETSEITVETKNKDLDSYTFTPGESHKMSNGFSVQWVSRTDNGNGTYTYTFTVTTDAI